MPDILKEIRPLFILALPLILAQVAQNSMSFIDTVMVGRLGEEALAGIALGGSVYFWIFVLGMGLMFSVNPMVSQAHGAEDAEAVGRSVRQGFWMALTVTLPAFILYWNIEPILLAIGQKESVAHNASLYMRAISWGYLANMILIALRGMLEGLSNPRPIMFITIAGVGLNIFFNYSLIFGNFGFPALGLVGSGYASSIVAFLMLIIAIVYVQRRYSNYQIFSKLRTPDPKVFRELFSLGWPISLSLSFESGLFTLTSVLMGLIGTTELAAHQIATQTTALMFMIPVGLSTATSVRVGQAIGRRSLEEAARAGYVGMMLSVAFMVFTATSFWLFPDAIVRLFVDTRASENQEVARFAAYFLGFAAMFQLVDGLQVSAAGALRGLKDTKVPMFLTLIAYWIVGMPVSVLLAFVFDFDGAGLWLGLVFGLATAAALLFRRFRWRVKSYTFPSKPEMVKKVSHD